MSYLPSILLAAVGLILLGVLLIAVVRGLRRFRSALSMVVTSTNDRAGLIRARSAGVRVALQQRRRVMENQ
ncbi:bacteriophage holin [Amycolatopsis sp. GM8]|uniref:bacteriophage holin n=1 Tax=Amycolatopsis sp. GM8 TaxID=2896530 RepID=UPI001F3331B7|nr:bacteriophage holin [Amycolatopsis sp. GM8]